MYHGECNAAVFQHMVLQSLVSNLTLKLRDHTKSTDDGESGVSSKDIAHIASERIKTTLVTSESHGQLAAKGKIVMPIVSSSAPMR